MPFIANRGEGWVELNPAPKDSVLISITDPKREKAKVSKLGYLDVLYLCFQDYDSEQCRFEGIISNPPDDAVLFTKREAAQVARFARKHRGKNIIVHCAAGISRSGAVAEALLEAFPEYEDQGWKRFPNGRVKTLLKRALGLVPIGAEEEE